VAGLFGAILMLQRASKTAIGQGFMGPLDIAAQAHLHSCCKGANRTPPDWLPPSRLASFPRVESGSFVRQVFEPDGEGSHGGPQAGWVRA
jgi:hypothetical protein